ncbi:hypothetical protein [Polyangium jinanense]|uniref:Uncharacterized protein n=1 Tax=Polyangium jinanense TaxID=2829994 RepID=A0A9X4AWT4_9BACT|nr:hypothetical protein [Polyangium jinanense]MDC3985610.1 hypothetical protein [Polyangium jinanense]
MDEQTWELVNKARRLGESAFAPGFGSVVACGEHLVACDGERLRRLDPGKTHEVMLQARDVRLAQLAADGAHAVIVALSDEEVWRVPIEGGDAEVVARGQEEPRSPVVLDARAAWLDGPSPPRWKDGHPVRVRLEGREEPIHEHHGVGDLIACSGALFWRQRERRGAKSFRTDLHRWDPTMGRAEVIAVLEEGDSAEAFGLVTDGKVIAWISGQRISVLDPVTGARRSVEVGAESVCALPVGDDLLVVVGREDVGELIRLGPDGGQRKLARWYNRSRLWTRLVLRGDEVVWAAGERLLAVTLSPGAGA